MNKWLTLLLVIGMCSCKDKKVNLAGDAPVKVNDFISAFNELPLPYTVADTNIAKVGDTTLISAAVFSQFIPDTALGLWVNGLKKYTIHPIGRIQKTTETYLLAIINQNKKIQLIAFVLDKKNNYLASKSLFNNVTNDGYTHSLSINKEPTFLISKEKITNKTKQLLFTRAGWVYNSENGFMVVINDTNEDPKKSNQIINPIDTLPKKNKISGDYLEDKKNYISIRDGKDVNSYIFFIHFEKKNGTCIGELKGDFKMKNATTAAYNQGGDPCVIDFTFSGNNVTLKEKGSCGNRRGMECFFDDTFTKKRELKTVKKKR
ncbi:MAG: hypothetical protein H7101_02560 [Deinococcales bacterium]|nr:hypothetical protein [Chitinophagaceae bacterium]